MVKNAQQAEKRGAPKENKCNHQQKPAPPRAHYRLESQSELSQHLHVLDLTPMQNLVLRGGFVIAEVRLTSQFVLDPLGRPATAQTVIRGSRFQISLRAELSDTVGGFWISRLSYGYETQHRNASA